MADRRAPWWFWTYLVASFLIGVAVIVMVLLDHEPWWFRLAHLVQAVILVAIAVFFYLALGPLRRRRRVKKRSLPPL
ncbi:hypothetical protein JHN63_27915 [Streptomyces sp. MBT65]|uniref:hypothetical protein n=1 Tax=Streptomyces sp. MBT65 TaxID=1488395 RepID=UPI0019098A19|nr:hypothetical protein [Streptomyces sp. MBT65]MBK3577557.1 hypothetical protein [Streptomyces sp. MBT65]